MRPNTSRATVTILAAGTLVLLLLLAAAFYRIGSEEKETKALMTAAQERAAKEADFQSLRALQVDAKADLEAFDQIAFSEGKLVSVIETMEKMGAVLGASVSIASVDKTETGLRLTVEVSGSWRATYLFLRATETLPYKFSLESAALNREEKDWHGNLTLFFPTFK